MPSLAGEIQENYGYYRESQERPWPFYVGTPYEENGHITVLWDASYDMDGEDITYSFTLARDYNFQDVLYTKEDIRLPEASFDMLEPGTYFIRVLAKNESGYVQACYDYYSTDNEGKAYGAKAFTVKEDGTIEEVENVE